MFSNQSKCICRSLIGFRRTGQYAGIHTVHPWITGDTQKVEIKNEQVHAVVEVYSATSEIAGWSVVNTLLNITSPIVF